MDFMIKQIPVSNQQGEDKDGNPIYIDRIYGDLYKHSTLVQKDGSDYTGKLYHKRRLIQGHDGNNYYSQCTVTADDRWFDNAGMPMEKPKQVETDPDKADREPEKPTINEFDMLKKLK